MGVFLPLLTVILSVIWTIGLMALVGFSFTIVSVITPVILVAIGSAYGIHIMNKYYEAIRKDISAKEAVLKTMREMNSPVIMTAFTTAGGFITLTTSFTLVVYLTRLSDIRAVTSSILEKYELAPFLNISAASDILKNLSLKEVSDRVSTIINARTETFKLLMESFDADFGVLVYTILDRIQHLFWHKKDFVLSIYKLIDEKINELLNYFNSPIIIISDHGFRGTRRGLVMCLMLRELGYLKFRDDYSKLLLSIIKMKISGGHPTIEYQSIDWRKTLAYFRRDSWSVILNLLNRQANGIIHGEEYMNMLRKLIADLKSTGLFKRIHKRSTIYQGPYVNRAPDILLIISSRVISKRFKISRSTLS